MFAVLATGLVLAWLGGWWGARWMWASLALFVATWAAMYRFGTKHYDRVRAGAGAKEFYPTKGAAPPPGLPPEGLDALLRSRRPFYLGAFGALVLAAFFWMMMFKPF